MARALISSVKRIEKKRRPAKTGVPLLQLLTAIERDDPFRGFTDPPPPPTIIDMPKAVALPEPEPPPLRMSGQPTGDIPEHMQIRPVTWRLRGPQDWADDNEDMVGRCLTEYDVLGDVDDE